MMISLPRFSDLLIEAGKRLNAGEPHERVMSALGNCTTQTRWQAAPRIARVLRNLIERESAASGAGYLPWVREHRADNDGRVALSRALRLTR